MIHEIAPHKYDNSFHRYKPNEQDIALTYKGGDILMVAAEGEKPALPTFAQTGGCDALAEGEAVFLFCIDDTRYFWRKCAEEPLGAGLAYISLQKLREDALQVDAFAGMTGSQLYRWYRDHAVCGRCGKPTELSTTERAVQCDACKLVVYPKISPAVIVAVYNGDKLLMARGHSTTYRRYGLIAGFVEIGETFEECVIREVREEVGLSVKNIRYYKSQPWAVSDSEMIGFFAELDGDDTIHLQESELSEAVWFSREDIPPTLTTQSIAQELINAVRYGTHLPVPTPAIAKGVRVPPLAGGVPAAPRVPPRRFVAGLRRTLPRYRSRRRLEQA